VFNNFGSFIWFFLWSFAFVAYLFALFAVVADLFRDRELSGWWKAVWVIFLVFVPFLTVLVYLIVRGKGMAERSPRYAPVPEDDNYQPSVPANPASEIANAKELLDKGVISAGEFDAIKAKALGNRY
jgi:hypothetical protein